MLKPKFTSKICITPKPGVGGKAIKPGNNPISVMTNPNKPVTTPSCPTLTMIHSPVGQHGVQLAQEIPAQDRLNLWSGITARLKKLPNAP
jgi:hypothetical protein